MKKAIVFDMATDAMTNFVNIEHVCKRQFGAMLVVFDAYG